MSNIKIEDDKLQTKIDGIRHNHFIRASLNYTETTRSIARNDKWNWKFDKSVMCKIFLKNRGNLNRISKIQFKRKFWWKGCFTSLYLFWTFSAMIDFILILGFWYYWKLSSYFMFAIFLERTWSMLLAFTLYPISVRVKIYPVTTWKNDNTTCYLGILLCVLTLHCRNAISCQVLPCYLMSPFKATAE